MSIYKGSKKILGSSGNSNVNVDAIDNERIEAWFEEIDSPPVLNNGIGIASVSGNSYSSGTPIKVGDTINFDISATPSNDGLGSLLAGIIVNGTFLDINSSLVYTVNQIDTEIIASAKYGTD